VIVLSSKLYSRNQIRLYFFLALLLLAVPSLFVLMWGVVYGANLMVLGNTWLGLACYVCAIVVAAALMIYFVKIVRKLYRLLKVSSRGQ